MRFKFLKKLLSPRRFSCSNTTINIDALEAQSQKLSLYVQFRDTVIKINNKVCMTLPSETSASPPLFPPHSIRDSHATMQHYATMQCIMSGGGLASVIPCHYAPTVDLRTASTSSLNGQCAFTHYDLNPKKDAIKKHCLLLKIHK